MSQENITIAIAGNPNCGKSALFNALTGINQKTGNWPGVTVDRREGTTKIESKSVKVVDLPGIYSLDAASLDEQISRDYLLSHDADLIINVIDASNLERNLYLTVQLLEMGVPIVVALNMMDVAASRGINLDFDALGQKLGCPVSPIVAVSGAGVELLKENIIAVINKEKTGGFRLTQDELIENAISDLLPAIDESGKSNGRWVALKALEGIGLDDSLMTTELVEAVAKQKQSVVDRTGEEIDTYIANNRFTHAHTINNLVTKSTGDSKKTITDHIDKMVLSRIFGIPIFLGVMYLMFMFTINIGGAFIDFFDILTGSIFIDSLRSILSAIGTPEWLQVLLADGAGGGIQVVATFIPVVAALYLFLSVLEDSGYIARAAFIMNRFMRKIGLPGKAFVPLIVGFGCNVPAIMATRTLESQRERKLTILMNPFMSCGARLPVYVLFAAAFFPSNGQNLVFILYLTGIVIAIATGLIMKNSLLPGSSSGFIMELPSYHRPSLKSVLLRTWDRVKVFIRDAGKYIIVMVMFLNILNSIGTDGSFGNENSGKSILSATSKQLTPIFKPMGLTEENWPAVVGIISGALAKEVVVGTLDTLYTQIAQQENPTEEAEFSFIGSLGEAVSTIPSNLADVTDNLLDPLGINISDIVIDNKAAADELEISSGTFGVMQQYFAGAHGAFAFLLFVLMYFPCVAVLGAVKREAGSAWAWFVAFWSTLIAYVSASVYFQVVTFSQHPTNSAILISSLLAALLLVIVALKYWARKGKNESTETQIPVFTSGSKGCH